MASSHGIAHFLRKSIFQSVFLFLFQLNCWSWDRLTKDIVLSIIVSSLVSFWRLPKDFPVETWTFIAILKPFQLIIIRWNSVFFCLPTSSEAPNSHNSVTGWIIGLYKFRHLIVTDFVFVFFFFNWLFLYINSWCFKSTDFSYHC